MNPNNNDDKGFQYSIAVALNHEQIQIHPERISNIKPIIDWYNWQETEFPSHKKDWKNFELNNISIALNILYVPYNTEEIKHAYKSKHNLKPKNQVIILMITDGKKWHYFAPRRLSSLLRGITLKHDGDFYCLNYLHLYSTMEKIQPWRKIYESSIYYLC